MTILVMRFWSLGNIK